MAYFKRLVKLLLDHKFFDWKRSSGWEESWEGLLLVTDVSTTCAEATQVVETSVTNNSPSQDFYHPDDLFQSRYVTPGFKPLSSISSLWEWIGDCRDEMLAYVLGSPMLLCCREVLWLSLSIGSVILILWHILVNLNILLEGKTTSCKVKAQEFLLGITLDWPSRKGLSRNNHL